MAKKNQIKTRVILIVAGGVLIILVAASIVSGSIQQKREKENNAANVSVDRINLKDDSSQAQQVSDIKTEVEIQFEDCAIPVGTQLKMTALVIPEDTEQALIWSCSDTSAADIDKEGILTIKAAGTTVVTATLGTVSDSIVIEGIENVAQGSKSNLPVYTGTTLAKGDHFLANNSSDDSSSSDKHEGGLYSGSTDDKESTGTFNQTGENSTLNGGGKSENTAGSNNLNSNNSNGSMGNTSSSDTSGDFDYSGNDSSAGNSSGNTDGLSQLGFTQRYSNVYVCEENGSYYGEIITQPNVTIIYIKQRSASFDSRIQTVLQGLLPNEYNQVWNNYVSASTDRTFTAEDRKVRIVAAPNGGHTQIVIYN